MVELIDYTERLTRAAIRELPDGEWSFEDWIDDDGIDLGRPIPLKVTLTKRGDRMVADWTGSSPQVKGAINNTLLVHARRHLHLHQVRAAPRRSSSNAGFYRRHRGDRAARHHRQLGAARRPAPRAASPASACSTAASARWPGCCPTG